MAERLLRVPEVARTLGIEGAEVYGLFDRDELSAGKGADGLVYVSAAALGDFVRRRPSASR